MQRVKTRIEGRLYAQTIIHPAIRHSGNSAVLHIDHEEQATGLECCVQAIDFCIQIGAMLQDPDMTKRDRDALGGQEGLDWASATIDSWQANETH